MTDKELLDKIRQSAEQIDLPDSITPESISSILKVQKNKSHNADNLFPQKRLSKAHGHSTFRKTASAAAVLLLCGVLSGVAFNTHPAAPKTAAHFETTEERSDGTLQNTAESSEKTLSDPQAKQNAGKLYTVAKSYEQVYDKLESYYSTDMVSRSFAENGIAMEESAADADGSLDTGNTQNLYSSVNSTSEMKKSESSAEKDSHSTTNLQTDGVDESDIIKTDGRFIYTVSDSKVIITDTSGHDLKPAGTIDPGLNSSDSILELFVDDDCLLFLVQHYETSLEKKPADDTSSQYYITNEDIDSGFLPLEGAAYAEEDKKINYISSDYSTILYVYDITNPSAPVLKGTGTQEGFYYTSRKIGNILYLFTQKDRLAQAAYYKNDTEEGGVIPCVNGKEIPYDHIYLPPSEGGSGLVLSSFQIDSPEENIDEVMIVYDSVTVYVGNDSIYLYNYDFNSRETLTQIAKFKMKDGIINAVEAASVRGAIYDTFAINEYQNTLRVLTTSYDGSGNSSNHLYLFDENMKLSSSLNGIAEGEEIYAARYLGDTAYFITYRNIDPLFAVDLSDIANPKLLGELKISGFSEYLHFWGNDKLLGIGYETDPDTGEQKGMKLVMFDISNPTDLKTIDSMVLKEYYFSPALYDYKCVLADPIKNLIGFAAEYNPSEYNYLTNYNVYSWEDDHFTKKLNEQLPDHISSDSIRGIYINDRFYIAGLTEITGFDMNNNFQKKWHLTLNK